MADRQLIKIFKEERRKRRVRKKVTGSPTRPRLCVFRSLRNISAQIIDDVSGMTLGLLFFHRQGHGRAGKDRQEEIGSVNARRRRRGEEGIGDKGLRRWSLIVIATSITVE